MFTYNVFRQVRSTAPDYIGSDLFPKLILLDTVTSPNSYAACQKVALKYGYGNVTLDLFMAAYKVPNVL